MFHFREKNRHIDVIISVEVKSEQLQSLTLCVMCEVFMFLLFFFRFSLIILWITFNFRLVKVCCCGGQHNLRQKLLPHDMAKLDDRPRYKMLIESAAQFDMFAEFAHLSTHMKRAHTTHMLHHSQCLCIRESSGNLTVFVFGPFK